MKCQVLLLLGIFIEFNVNSLEQPSPKGESETTIEGEGGYQLVQT